MWSNSIQSNRIKSWKKNKSSFTIFLRVCVYWEFHNKFSFHPIKCNILYSGRCYCFTFILCFYKRIVLFYTPTHTHMPTFIILDDDDCGCGHVYIFYVIGFFCYRCRFFFQVFFVFWLVFYCNIQNKCSFGSHP